MNVMTILNYIGVAAFAISGAYVAIQKRMDIFGVYVIAFSTACGGGILRDVVMDVGVPAFFSSYENMGIVLAVTTIAIMVKKESTPWQIFMLVCDAIGLAIFAIDAGTKAINNGYNFPQFIFVSTITAVGGGVIRDLLCQRVPVILRKEVYASCALMGATILWILYGYIGIELSVYISLTFIIAFRLFSVAKKVNLPIPKPKQ